MADKFKYCGEYPKRYWRQVIFEQTVKWFYLSLFLGSLLVLSGMGVWTYFGILRDEFSLGWALGCLVFAVAFSFFARIASQVSFKKPRPRIVPYFEKFRPDRLLHLKALFKHRDLADQIARSCGVTPLTDFAADRPVLTQPIRGDAAIALATVIALQNAFRAQNDLGGGGRDSMLKELESLKEILQVAANRKAWFSLARPHNSKNYWFVWVDRSMGGIDTFGSGYAIASRCRTLDRLAADHNLEPLSCFGFNDDRGVNVGKIKWHLAKRGLDAVTGLLEFVRQNPGSVAGVDEVISDLEKMKNALQRAADRNIPFALILRTLDDNRVSDMEMMVRRGTFW